MDTMKLNDSLPSYFHLYNILLLETVHLAPTNMVTRDNIFLDFFANAWMTSYVGDNFPVEVAECFLVLVFLTALEVVEEEVYSMASVSLVSLIDDYTDVGDSVPVDVVFLTVVVVVVEGISLVILVFYVCFDVEAGYLIDVAVGVVSAVGVGGSVVPDHCYYVPAFLLFLHRVVVDRNKFAGYHDFDFQHSFHSAAFDPSG